MALKKEPKKTRPDEPSFYYIFSEQHPNLEQMFEHQNAIHTQNAYKMCVCVHIASCIQNIFLLLKKFF